VLLVPLLPCRGVHLRTIGCVDHASDPAASADRCRVGGLLGGLGGASYIATVRQFVRPVTTRLVCFVPDSLDKSNSYQRSVSAAALKNRTRRRLQTPVMRPTELKKLVGSPHSSRDCYTGPTSSRINTRQFRNEHVKGCSTYRSCITRRNLRRMARFTCFHVAGACPLSRTTQAQQPPIGQSIRGACP
jgi:hypothetical protein